MPEITTIQLALLVLALIVAAVLGWFARGLRQRSQQITREEHWQEQMDAVRRSEKRINAQRKDLAAELAEVRTELNSLEKTAAPGDVDANSKLQDSYRRRDELNDQLKKLIARSRDMSEKSKQKDEKIFALSRELESWQQRLPPLLERYKDKDMQNTVILEQLEAERACISELKETLQTRIMPLTANVSAALADAPKDVKPQSGANDDTHSNKDDLKRIKGVGKVLEKTLNGLGIYRLSQIARLDDSEMQRIAEKLPQFSGRIKRDRWIEQARQLSDN